MGDDGAGVGGDSDVGGSDGEFNTGNAKSNKRT